MKRKRTLRWFHPASVILIIGASAAAAWQNTIPFYIMVAVSLLIFVKVMPFCRDRENMWMYFLTAVCTVPMNIAIVFRYIRIGRSVFLSLVFRSFSFLVLFSVEEIMMGYITRSLWPHQYRLPYTEKQAE